MITSILYTFIGLYILTKIIFALLAHWKKRKYFANWPQKPTYFLLGITELFSKLPLSHHFIPFLNKLCKEYGSKDKFFVAWVSYVPVVVTYNKDHVKKILSRNDSTTLNKGFIIYETLRETIPNNLLSVDTDDWRIRRRLLSAPFHVNSNTENITKYMNIESMRLVCTLKSQSIVRDVLHETKKTALSWLFNLLFEYELGDEVEYAIELTDNTMDVMTRKAFSIFVVSPCLYKMSPLSFEETRKIHELLQLKTKVLNAKMESSRQNLKSKMDKNNNAKIEGSKADNLTLIEILLKNLKGSIKKNTNQSSDAKWEGWDMLEVSSQLSLFIIAGVDTMSAGLMYIFYHLAKYPHLQDQVCQEIETVLKDDPQQELSIELVRKFTFLEAFIHESLRIELVIPAVIRHVTEDLELQPGFVVPAGTDVSINLQLLMNDPDYFLEPDQFKPERFLDLENKDSMLYLNIPFSGGTRNCIARRLALITLAGTTINILRNFSIEFTENTPTTFTDEMKRFEIISKPIDPVELKFVAKT